MIITHKRLRAAAALARQGITNMERELAEIDREAEEVAAGIGEIRDAQARLDQRVHELRELEVRLFYGGARNGGEHGQIWNIKARPDYDNANSSAWRGAQELEAILQEKAQLEERERELLPIPRARRRDYLLNMLRHWRPVADGLDERVASLDRGGPDPRPTEPVPDFWQPSSSAWPEQAVMAGGAHTPANVRWDRRHLVR
jgi:hypothetical protein